MLFPKKQDPAAALVRRHAAIAQYTAFSTALQEAITAAFCVNPALYPTDGTLRLQLWFNASGAVVRSRVRGSGDQVERNAALMEVLGRVIVSLPPPADLPQPAKVSIGTDRSALPCRAAGRPSR